MAYSFSGTTARMSRDVGGMREGKGDGTIMQYAPLDRYGVPIAPGDTVWYADEYTAGGVHQDYVVSEIGSDGKATYVKATHTKAWQSGACTYDHRCFRIATGERFAYLSHENPDSHERIASEMDSAVPSEVTADMLADWSKRVRALAGK